MKRAFVLIMTLILVSCSTTAKFKEKDFMYAMVYDMDGNTVDSASFTLDDKDIGKSDIYGRFVFEVPVKGDANTHSLKIRKQGFVEIDDEIRLYSSGVLYYKMGNAQQYFEVAEKAFDDKNYTQALQNIESAEKIESADDIIYLKALILSKMGRKEEALKTVEKAERKIDVLLGEIAK